MQHFWNLVVDYFTHLTLGRILTLLGAVIVVQKVMADVFGLDMLGRKLYKGAPGIWKRMIRMFTWRKEMMNKLDKINEELQFNGGQKIKDYCFRIENKVDIQTDVWRELKTIVDFNALRLDIYDHSNDRMIFKVDPSGACIFINDSFLKFFGYTDDDILNHSWESIIADKDREDVILKWHRAIETKSNYFGDYCVCDRDGKCWECIVRAWPVIMPGTNELKLYWGICQVKDLQFHNQ